MSRILPNAVQPVEVQTLDRVSFKSARAGLKSPSASMRPSQRPSASDASTGVLLDRLTRTVESALLEAHGSQKAAAIEVGCDQSQMRRQLKLGTFDLRQSAAAGEIFLAQLGALLTKEFGSGVKSKQQIARERLPELLAVMLAATDDQ